MTIRSCFWTLPAALFAMTICPIAAAQFQPLAPGQDGRNDQVKVRAMVDSVQIAPRQTFQVAVIFEISPKWHIYWKNPGEGAAAPGIDLGLPEGYKAGEIQWPRPKVITDSLGESYGYEDQTILFIPVTAPNELREGAMMATVNINWAVCNDERCVMGSKALTLSVPTVGDSIMPPPQGEKAGHPALETYRKRLPAQLDKVKDASVTVKDDELTITGPARGHKDVAFLPHATPGVSYGKPVVSVDQDRFTMTIALDIKPGNSLGKPLTAGGLVALGSRLDDPSFEFSMPVAKSERRHKEKS